MSVDSNTFIAATRAGYMEEAVGGSVYFNGDNTDVMFSNNLFKGLVLGATDPGSSYTSGGFAVDRCNPGEDIRFVGNTFESDSVGLILGTSNAGSGRAPTSGLEFRDSVFRLSSDGVPRSFVSYQFGYWTCPISDVSIINPTYQGGATNATTWTGTGMKSVNFGWELAVSVTDSSGHPIGGATVLLKDSSGNVLYSGASNAQGVAVLDVNTLCYSGTTTFVQTAEGPSTLVVSANGFADHTEVISLIGNLNETIQMHP